MLKFPQLDNRDESMLQIKGWYWFRWIKLCRVVVLSVGIEILHMDGVDFEEDQIYSMDYKKYAMVIKHKKL